MELWEFILVAMNTVHDETQREYKQAIYDANLTGSLLTEFPGTPSDVCRLARTLQEMRNDFASVSEVDAMLGHISDQSQKEQWLNAVASSIDLARYCIGKLNDALKDRVD